MYRFNDWFVFIDEGIILGHHNKSNEVFWSQQCSVMFQKHCKFSTFLFHLQSLFASSLNLSLVEVLINYFEAVASIINKLIQLMLTYGQGWQRENYWGLLQTSLTAWATWKVNRFVHGFLSVAHFLAGYTFGNSFIRYLVGKCKLNSGRLQAAKCRWYVHRVVRRKKNPKRNASERETRLKKV